MERPKKIKLTSLLESDMADVKAGQVPVNCYCACRYADSGGSSTVDNAGANDENGYWSP